MRWNEFKKHCVQWLLSIGALLALTACAGPTTPFGAVHSILPPKKAALKDTNVAEKERLKAERKLHRSNRFFSPKQEKPKFEFSPERQVLHDRSHLTVTIEDPLGLEEDAELRVYHNGIDVTSQVVQTKRTFIDENKSKMTVEIPSLRIRPEKENKIQFVYRRSKASHEAIIKTYRSPECSIYDENSIISTAPFEPPARVLKSLESWSLEHQVNPSLLAGLVAQESAFNPKAVSWAKAIGLTQMTPVADRQISRVHSDWPRSKKIDRFPAGIVKSMVVSGQISPDEDWRLNPELSLRGGLAMMDYLKSYWELEENRERLSRLANNGPSLFTPVLLASYHSGASRVKRAIDQHDRNFLSSKELNEARKYVRLVSSYCYHFSHSEEAYAQTP